MNTTRYNLEVTLGEDTYRPVISVADNGTWTIDGHEAVRDRVGPDAYAEWLCDAWHIIRKTGA